MGAVRPEEDSGLAVWALALEPPRPDTPTRRRGPVQSGRGGDTWGARSRARAQTASPLSSSGRTHRSQTFQRTWGDAGGREREPERPVYCASYQATSKTLLTSSQENARRFALFPLSVSLSLSPSLRSLSLSFTTNMCLVCRQTQPRARNCPSYLRRKHTNRCKRRVERATNNCPNTALSVRRRTARKALRGRT